MSEGSLRVWLGTYNVNGQDVLEADLAAWFDTQVGQIHAEKDEGRPDIIAASFQEALPYPTCLLVDRVLTQSLTNMILRTANRVWNTSEQQQRGAKNNGDYEVVTALRLVSTQLVVLANRHTLVFDHRWVSTGMAACGVGNLMGDKGAVGARLDMILRCVHGQRLPVPRHLSLSFVGAHLTANEGCVAQRLQDLAVVFSRMVLTDREGRLHAHPLIGEADHVVFLLGDLNFRVMKDSQEDFLGSLLPGTPATHDNGGSEEQQEEELQKDELVRFAPHDPVLSRFVEPPIRFPQTYKYFPGSDRFHPMRVPSWCDRILYYQPEQSKPFVAVDCLFYRSIPSMQLSDHKPVSALYKIALLPLPDAGDVVGVAGAGSMGIVPIDPWWLTKLQGGRLMDYLTGKLLISMLIAQDYSRTLGIGTILLIVGYTCYYTYLT